MRIYISGAVTGTDDAKERFHWCEEYLRNLFYTDGDEPEIINPERVCAALPKTFSHDDYMRICLYLLGESDRIYLMRGWRDSPGAVMEWGYARLNGIPVVYQEFSDNLGFWEHTKGAMTERTRQEETESIRQEYRARTEGEEPCG